MRTYPAFAALACTLSFALLTGCAVMRGQESVGAYIDDTTITTTVKKRFVENPQVDASAISVETLQGTVLLSGFSKSSTERSAAEALASKVKGVRQVRNEIIVKP